MVRFELQRRTMNKLIFCVSIFLALCSVPALAIKLIGMPGSEQAVPTHPRIHSPSKKSGNRSARSATIDWHPWVSTQNFRYRTGYRDTGSASWERYLELASTTGAVVRFSGIRCGNIAAGDVALSPATPLVRIKLICEPLAIWRWDATVLLNQ
jgi:hypothetical protein